MGDLTGCQRGLVAIAGHDNPKRVERRGELGGYRQGEVDHGRLCPNLGTLLHNELVGKRRHGEWISESALRRRGQRELKARYEWEHQHVETNG